MPSWRGLLRGDSRDDAVFHPAVAESWTHSPEADKWRFSLRKDVVWSDGVPVTAHDFVYAYHRLLHPGFGGRYADMLYPLKNAEAYNRNRRSLLLCGPGSRLAGEEGLEERVLARVDWERLDGMGAAELEALRDKAREMGSKTKFSASEAAEAMNYMAMAGWKTSDMLSGIEGIMNLAAASGEDLATTSDIVTDALTAFGLTAADSGHFADILAAASSNANTNVSMMGETFKYCAPIAGALGFSAEDTAEAIGLMGNAGIKSTQAGTALRTIMSNLSGEVKICGNSIGEVTIATTNADGSMRDLSAILADCRTAFGGLSESEKAAAAEALVGKNAMSGFLALMNAAPADIEKVSSAIANCDGKSAEMAATMQDNLAGQLTILKSQLEELAISFGEILMPAIRQIVTWVQGFVDKLNGMDEGTKNTIVTIGLLAAAIGPVLIVIGKVVSAVGQHHDLHPDTDRGHFQYRRRA